MTLTLLTVMIVVLIGLGFWALVLTGHFLNIRQTKPGLVLTARVVFIVLVVLLLVMSYVPNKIIGG